MLFEFNWFSHSFPALCIQCLSAPLLFLSAPRNADQPSWPIEAPGADQLRDLQALLESKVLGDRKEWPDGGHDKHGTNGDTERHRPRPGTNEKQAVYFKHLTDVYQAWVALSEKQRLESWRLECQKALTREQENHKITIARLDRAEREIQQLQVQLDKRSRHQQPVDFLHHPPRTIPLSQEALQVLDEDTEVLELDYERAIHKWKTRIQQDRNAQQPLPGAPVSNPWPSISEAGSRINGMAPYPPLRHSDQHNNHHKGPLLEHDLSDDDEDIVDAPGDDDVVPPGNVQVSSETVMDHRVLDPDLDRRPDILMNNDDSSRPEVNSDGYTGRKLLLGLKDFEPTTAGTDGDV